MSKYIDADETLEQIRKKLGVKSLDYLLEAERQIVAVIQSMPSIDIVFCKECKHWRNTDAEKIPTASIACGNMHTDDFCSYGQKGDENVETD